MKRKIALFSFLFIFESSALACPEGAVRIIVYNTSHNILHLEAKDEHTCKLHHVSRVRPGIKGKYCLNHNYMLKVTTLSLKGETRLAITATDLWDDLIVSTPKDQSPDIEFHHIHNKSEEKNLQREENSIDSEALKKTIGDAKKSGISVPDISNKKKSDKKLDKKAIENKNIAEEFKNLFN